MASRPRKTGGNGAVGAVAADIDALGDEGSAILLAQLYTNISEQLKNLEFSQLINDASDEAIIPGPQGPMLDESGAPLSYGARRKQLVESKARAKRAGAAYWPLVEKVIEAQKRERAKALAG